MMPLAAVTGLLSNPLVSGALYGIGSMVVNTAAPMVLNAIKNRYESPMDIVVEKTCNKDPYLC